MGLKMPYFNKEVIINRGDYMNSDVREINPPISITIGDNDIHAYTAPDKLGTAKWGLKSGESYKVTGMSNTDPNWLRIEIKTTGEGGRPLYYSEWVYADQDAEGNTVFEGTTVADQVALVSNAKDVVADINAGGTGTNDPSLIIDSSEELKSLLATNNNATEIIDASSKNHDEIVVLYDNDYQQSLDALYEHYLLLAVKAFGAPPQSTPYADPRIISLKTNFGPTILIGRKFADVIISNPTIVSLCPGIVKYNSILAGTFDAVDEDSIVEQATQALSSDKNGKICEFQPCWYSSVKSQPGYLKFVNALNTISAIAMSRQKINDDESASLADRTFPGSSSKYKDFDWVHYDEPDNDVERIFGGNSSGGISTDNSIVENAKAVLGYIGNAVDSVINEVSEAIGTYKYINFYCSGSGTVRESFETSVRSSSLEDTINGSLSSVIKEVAFYTGGLIGDNAKSDIDQWIAETSDSLGSGIGGLLANATELFSGGRLVFPQIVDDCTYGKECQFTVRFVAGSGNCEARYLMRCEFNHLLAFILPKQLKGTIDMYTTPFLVRAVCKGRFSCELGVITGVQVSYGGQDDMAWTADGQPTEMEVTFSITPLYTKLYMTSIDDIKGMFLKNTGMMEYLLVNSGVDLRIPQMQMKIEILKGLSSGYVTSNLNPENIFESLANSKLANAIKRYMNF